MSREFCRDVPDRCGCSESLCRKSSCAFFSPYQKLGLAPKVLQSPTFLQQGFNYAKRSAEPSCWTPKVLQKAGEPLGAPARLFIRRVKSTPDPDIFEKYRDTPPISIAIFLQKYALLLAEVSIYTTNLYHDMAPICIAMLLQKHSGQESLEHPQFQALQTLLPKNWHQEKVLLFVFFWLFFREVLGYFWTIYSYFANSYLPITYFSVLINIKLPMPLPMLYCFELIKVTVADGPVSVLAPPSQNCPKDTDS